MSLSSRIIPLYVILVRQDAGDAHAAIVVCWSEAAGETGTGQGGDAWSDAESMTAQGGSRLLGAWSAGSCALRACMACCSRRHCTTGASTPPGCAAWSAERAVVALPADELQLCAAKGCPVLAFFATTSDAFGVPAMARAIDSFVAW